MTTRERAIQFGASSSLVGVLCEPVGEAAPPEVPAVIMLNAGILHRVGACRLHVNLARSLAELGIPALRFDFSGIGDSPPRKDALSFAESAPLEAREAMDYMSSRLGRKRFIILGLCSGADIAFETSLQDERVVGLMQLDAWAYRNWKHYWHHYRRRMLRLSVWSNLVRRKLARFRSAGVLGNSIPEDLDLPTYVRESPPVEQVREQMQRLADRGVRFFYIFSGGQEEYNYRNQFRDTFRSVDFHDHVHIEYHPQADHIFTGLADQTAVVGSAGEWIRANFEIPSYEQLVA